MSQRQLIGAGGTSGMPSFSSMAASGAPLYSGALLIPDDRQAARCFFCRQIPSSGFFLQSERMLVLFCGGCSVQLTGSVKDILDRMSVLGELEQP